MAQQLVGSHGVILEWIGKQPWGEAVVFEGLGLYYMTGSQAGEGKAELRTGWRSPATSAALMPRVSPWSA